MNKYLYSEFKKIYIQLKILLEKSKGWKNANLEEIKINEEKLEEIWKQVNAKYADWNTKKMDW